MAIIEFKRLGLTAADMQQLELSGIIQLGDVNLGFNPSWFYSFPFESRFSNIRRTDQFLDAKGNTVGKAIIHLQDASHNLNFFSYQNDGGMENNAFVAPRNFNDFPTNILGNNDGTGVVSMTYSEACRILFGIGDLNRGRYFVRASNGSDPVGLTYHAGFKYGISNTSPNYSKAIYSRNRFGQFRDLMEMRTLTTYNHNHETVFPIEQKFITRSGQPLSKAQRHQTNCSNISTNATSSIPFFDRDDNTPTNRDPITTSTANISPNFVVGNGPFIRSTGF